MLTADDLKHIKENYRLNYPEYYITATTYIEMLLNHIEAMQKEIERKDRAIEVFKIGLKGISKMWHDDCGCLVECKLACETIDEAKTVLEGKE